MSFLPKEVQSALDEAHRTMQRRAQRLCVHVGDNVYPIARLWDDGFSISLDDAPKLRGFVDLYDGPRHLSQCLIVTSRDETYERVYEFKWSTTALDHPPVDYIREEGAPVGLLMRPD